MTTKPFPKPDPDNAEPLVRGGQGRTAYSLIDSAMITGPVAVRGVWPCVVCNHVLEVFAVTDQGYPPGCSVHDVNAAASRRYMTDEQERADLERRKDRCITDVESGLSWLCRNGEVREAFECIYNGLAIPNGDIPEADIRAIKTLETIAKLYAGR